LIGIIRYDLAKVKSGSAHLQLILPIAIVFTLPAAGFAGLFWKLASRFDARLCTTEWLDAFSLEPYAPMQRLLEKEDTGFLASQPGYRPEIARRLMAERRRIFAAYLGNLVRDFNQLAGVGKLMIVYSTDDQREFARGLWRQRLRFYAAVCSVWLQLALNPLGWSRADAHRLLAALMAMCNRVVLLSSPSEAQYGMS
jgi:hypothetical protein